MLTPREFNSIISALKRCFSRSARHKEVLLSAVHPDVTGPRGGKQYICSRCDNTFPQSKVQVDHIEPVIPVDTVARDMEWQQIIDRLFCEAENLQVLCKNCHNKKSSKERSARAKARAIRKADRSGNS